MEPRLFGILLSFVLLFGPLATAQQLTRVPASEALRHVSKAFPPDYPALATVANITGKVVLQVTISAEGRVTDARMVSGHPLFEASAVRAVRLWRYQPFIVDGAAVPIVTQVYLLFGQGPEEQKYMLQDIECRDLLQAKHYNEAAVACKVALQTAQKSHNGLDRIAAAGNAGQVAMHLDQISEAVQDFQSQLQLAKKVLQPDDAQWAAIHHDLAVALSAVGQMEQVEIHYVETEKAFDVRSKSLQHNRGSYSKEVLARLESDLNQQLRPTLEEHAALLRKMGRNPDADGLDQRAKALSAAN